ncbi:hypothetical protein L198_03522 [Cryptococcus wingfieldii CBS 7118]|uniref:Histone chaperone domain-containing protein n=1 Tax=Cryptococcus wingfieldii CBS 7118 TaxID=1295528 RepID=A0A1E3JBQ0_9TREE|nr:hypothetical protein L198_03522 [Cryptococcus wingfieldii CBS 7118]ODN98279.1 hypothetical protein L198_03522 [Cryptococcus wingfieldii CBS 7118]
MSTEEVKTAAAPAAAPTAAPDAAAPAAAPAAEKIELAAPIETAKEPETGDKRKAEEPVVSEAEEKKTKVDDVKGKGKSTDKPPVETTAPVDEEEEDLDTLIQPGRRNRKPVNYADPEAWKKAELDPNAPEDDDDKEDAVPEESGDEDEDDDAPEAPATAEVDDEDEEK